MSNEEAYILSLANESSELPTTSDTPEFAEMNDPSLSTDGFLTPASTEAEVPRPLEVPSWFINGCIKTWEELSSCEIPLSFYDSLTDKDDSAATEAGDKNHYEIHTAIYEPLRDLYYPVEETGDVIWKFGYDAMGIRMPHEKHGQRFLEIVVQRFAMDTGADMITLGLHDFENLAAHFATESGHSLPKDVTAFRDLYFDEFEESFGESTTDETTQEKLASDGDTSKAAEQDADKPQDPELPAEKSKKPTFPFETVFASISKTPLTANRKQEKRPVIILLTEIQEDFYSSTSSRLMLRHLRDYVRDARAQGKEIVIIAADNQPDPVYGYDWPASPSEDAEFLSDIGFNPMKIVTLLVPKKSEAQKKLLEEDYKKTARKRKIRKLQDSIREQRPVRSFSGLLEPYAEWEISEGSFAAKRLEEADFRSRELQLLAGALNNSNLGVNDVEKAFERLRVLYDWMEETKEEEEKKKCKWDNLHEGARTAIEEVEKDNYKYEYENKLLESIVSSG